MTTNFAALLYISKQHWLQFLKATVMQVAVFWDVALRSLVKLDRRFRAAYRP
jgi:hypothetical protein